MTTGKTNTPPNKRRSFWEWLDDRYERFCSLSRMRQVVEGAGMFFAASIVILLFCHLTAEWVGYEKLKGGGNAALSPGVRFFRDLMVALAAVIGITIAARRTSALDRQSKTSEKRLLNERFATAAELMAKEIAGQPAIAARVSGIHIMEALAHTNPEYFLRQTLKNMVAYIKDNAQITAKPTKEKGEPLPDEARILGEDVKTAFAVIDGLFAKRESGGISGMLSPDILDFSNADFSHLNLNKQQVPEVRWFKKWREADLSGADLHRAELKHADFTGAIMHGADLSRAELGGANLCYAQLQGASLFHAYLQDPPPVLHDPDFVSSKADFYWAI